MSAPHPDSDEEFELYVLNAAYAAGWLPCIHCGVLTPAEAMGVQIDIHDCDIRIPVSITFDEFTADRIELDNFG